RYDIRGCVDFLMTRFTLETKKNLKTINQDALDKLIAHYWPGNVRELANVIERAVVLGRGPKITRDELPATVASTHSTASSVGSSYNENVGVYRRQLTLKALAEAQGNRAAAADA